MVFNTEDFLWYSYFGITRVKAQNNKNLAMKKCIERAYADMQRTINFKYSNTELKSFSKNKRNKFQRRKNNFKKREKEIIQTGIGDNILGFNKNYPEESVDEQQHRFDGYHKAICEDIHGKGKGKSKVLKSKLTYGQAQKWLNMTLKYMVIMGLWEKELSVVKALLHIPLDNYILKAVFDKDERNKINNGSEILIYMADLQGDAPINNDGELLLDYWNAQGFSGNYKNSMGKAVKSLAWSKINAYKDYELVQNKVKECIPTGMSPLEWENRVWLEEAK